MNQGNQPNLAWNTVSWASTALLGVVFLGSGLLKAPMPGPFGDQILRLLGADPDSRLGPLLAGSCIGLEIALGVLLFLRVRPKWTLTGATVLILGFVLVIGRAKALGERDCGCFGEQLKRSPEQALIEDALLLLVATFGLVATARIKNRLRPKRSEFAALLLAAIGGFLAASPLASTVYGPERGVDLFREGRYIGNLADNSPAAANGLDLREEELVLVLIDEESLEGDELRTAIADLAESLTAPPVATCVIDNQATDLTPRETTIAQPTLESPAYSIPSGLAKGLEDRVPMTLFLYKGTIEKIWSGVAASRELECQVEDVEEPEFERDPNHHCSSSKWAIAPDFTRLSGMAIQWLSL